MKGTFAVKGMTCDGCAKAVANAIARVAPKAKVTVDLEKKTVSVDGFDSEPAIAAAVKDAGFELAGRAA